MNWFVENTDSNDASANAAGLLHNELQGNGFNVVTDPSTADIIVKVEDIKNLGCPYDPESQFDQGDPLTCTTHIHIVMEYAHGSEIFDQYFPGHAPENSVSVGNGGYNDAIVNALPNIYDTILGHVQD